jgi:hypothetical protein
MAPNRLVPPQVLPKASTCIAIRVGAARLVADPDFPDSIVIEVRQCSLMIIAKSGEKYF